MKLFKKKHTPDTVVIVEKWSKENGIVRHQMRAQEYDEQPFEEMLIIKDETSTQ